MSAVQVLQKKRPSSSQQQSTSSSRLSTMFPTRLSQQNTSKKMRSSSSSGTRLRHVEPRMDSHSGLARQKSVIAHTTQKVSAAMHIGNLTTTYRQEQETMQTLQKKMMTETRAYKEAQRNSRTANQDLNNAVAESKDRRVRLDEVSEVFKDCEMRASRVESDQRLLRDMILEAKYDVECSHEVASRLNAKKKRVLATIIGYFSLISEKTEAVRKFIKGDMLAFKHVQMQFQSDIDLKKQRLLDLRQSIECSKERNLQLNITSAEDTTEIEKLNLEWLELQAINAKLKPDVQHLKKKIEEEETSSQEELSVLQKELKNAGAVNATSMALLTKVSLDESRLIKQQSSVFEENTSKEIKLKSSSVDFSSKLKSLGLKIDSLENNHSALEDKILSMTSTISDQKKSLESTSEAIEAIDRESSLLRTSLDDEQCKILDLVDQVAKSEEKAICFKDGNQASREKSSKQIESTKVELADMKREIADLELSQKKLSARNIELASESTALETPLKSSVNELEQLKVQGSLQISILTEIETKVKSSFQASEAVSISLGLEQKELEEKIRLVSDQVLKVENKMQTLISSDLTSLPAELKNELLPLSEIEEIKVELLKSNLDLSSEQQIDPDIAAAIAKETKELQEFNERKEIIRANNKMKLESEISKIESQMNEDQKAIDEVGLNFEEKVEQLKKDIEKTTKQIKKTEVETDNVNADIEQIKDFVVLSTKKKETRKHKAPTAAAAQDVLDETDEDLPSQTFSQSRKAKLTKNTQSEVVNYGDDEAEKETSILSKKLSAKRKKKHVSRRASAAPKVRKNALEDVEELDEEDDEADMLFSNEMSKSQVQPLPIKKSLSKSSASRTSSSSKLQSRSQLKNRKKSLSQSAPQVKSRDSMSSKDLTSKVGPHLIAGEDDDDDESSMFEVQHIVKSRKSLPALVPLDEKCTSPKSKQQVRNKRTAATSARGEPQPRSSVKKMPTSSSEKHRTNKKSKVTQEADWLFSSQDGFSF